MLTTVLHASPLVAAGVAGLLEPFPHRAVLLHPDPRDASRTDVVEVALYDATSQAGDRTRLDPRALRSLAPTARVVTVITADDADALAETRRCGASGAVPVSASGEEIVETLERVRDGEFTFPAPGPGHARVHRPVRASSWRGWEHGLSARESQMLSLICQGLGNDEIGRRTYLGANTVKTYIRGAYRKVGVSTRPQAIIWGLTHGFSADHAREREHA